MSVVFGTDIDELLIYHIISHNRYVDSVQMREDLRELKYEGFLEKIEFHLNKFVSIMARCKTYKQL